jgi:signal transduction histidine kinase
VIRSLHPKLKKTAHIVNVDCPEELTLHLPAGAISQIFTNLIMNSLIHGFEGIAQGTIDIEIREENNDVFIVYKDNGKGVSKAQLEKLFDPFFTTKREQGGSGLGTHITFNLVKQTLNGDIEVNSEEGSGLTYYIRFPKELQKSVAMFS